MKSTPIYELRKPHPNQAHIDAATAALLHATAPHFPPSLKMNEMDSQPKSHHQKTSRPLSHTRDTTTGRLTSS